MGFALGLIVVLVIGVVLAGQAGLLAGRAPADLGVREGRLKAPSKTENSVSSQAVLWAGHPMLDYARIEPLALVPGGGPATMSRLVEILRGTPGVTIIDARPDYIRAECRTALLKYTDDLELWLDPAAGVVQVRSASRLGRKDFGVNRKRVEALRQRLQAAG